MANEQKHAATPKEMSALYFSRSKNAINAVALPAIQRQRLFWPLDKERIIVRGQVG